VSEKSKSLVAKIGADDLDKSTTLESNKSLSWNGRGERRGSKETIFSGFQATETSRNGSRLRYAASYGGRLAARSL